VNVSSTSLEGGSKDNLVGETTNPGISNKSKNDQLLTEEDPPGESNSTAGNHYSEYSL
jgi:hypothetical protein